MLFAASIYLWKRGARLEVTRSSGDVEIGGEEADDLARLILPTSLFAAAMGLVCFAIAAAGWKYTLWAAPPQEPISGNFANHPLVEATFISLLYVGVGVGAVLLPVLLMTRKRVIASVSK
jgi:multisubunit Na+/H+ antiporter MnhC subunit